MGIFGDNKGKFDALKKAREIQKKLKNEVITVESGAVTIVINGEQKIQKVTIDQDDVDVEKLDILEKDIKTAVESAIKKSQEVAANMMKEMGDLSGLFGGM